MSLASLNLAKSANTGRTLVVLHPTHRTPLVGADGGQVEIDLLGQDSDAWIAGEHASRNKQVDAMRRGHDFSAAQADRAGGVALANVATGWRNVPKAWLTVDGTDEDPATFSAANAELLFNNPGMRWLREQADEHVAKRAGFLTT